MGVLLLAMVNVPFFNVLSKTRLFVDVPWHDDHNEFKRRVWRALSVTQEKDVDILKKEFIFEKHLLREYAENQPTTFTREMK